jgi:hypothetical protein
LTNTAAGEWPASVNTYLRVPSVWMSYGCDWMGIKTKSAAFAAAISASVLLPGVSMMARSAPPLAAASSTCPSLETWQETALEASCSRRSLQFAAVVYGSRSITATVRPARKASTANPGDMAHFVSNRCHTRCRCDDPPASRGGRHQYQNRQSQFSGLCRVADYSGGGVAGLPASQDI